MMLRRIHWTFIAIPMAIALCGASGCGQPYQLAEVEGQVTNGGQPVEGATLLFQPTGNADAVPGPPSSATTDANGRYHLATVDHGKSGAVVGRHKVFIGVAAGGAEQADGSVVQSDRQTPGRFRDGSLTLEVPAAGLVGADFDLRQASLP